MRQNRAAVMVSATEITQTKWVQAPAEWIEVLVLWLMPAAEKAKCRSRRWQNGRIYGMSRRAARVFSAHSIVFLNYFSYYI